MTREPDSRGLDRTIGIATPVRTSIKQNDGPIQPNQDVDGGRNSARGAI